MNSSRRLYVGGLGVTGFAWLFAMIMCGLGLFEAFLWMIEYPGSGIGLTNAILPLVLIWYLNTEEVRKEFGTSKQG